MEPRQRWAFSTSSGRWYPPRCKTWTCTFCGPIRARRMADAVDAGGYDRFLTVTLNPSDLLQAVARLHHSLSQGYPLEWVWTAETGKKTGMQHVHAVVRSDYIPVKFLGRCARKAGFGFDNDLTETDNQHGGYMAKAAGYAVKNAANYEPWLHLNGGKRPLHWSRNYTAGVPMRVWISDQLKPIDVGPFVMMTQYEIPREERNRYPLEWGLGYVPAGQTA